MRAAFAIAWADCLERMRRFSFLITLAIALYAGYLYAPDLSSSYITVSIDGHRGIYNSAWTGSATALLVAAFLGIFGFYLVRGSVERDYDLGTADVVASSRVRRVTFLLAKFLSNLSALLLIAGAMFAADVVMQLVRGEDRHIDIFAYALPFLISTIPAMAIVAALAITFDVVKVLRGVFGGMVYIFLASALLAVPLNLSNNEAQASPFDPFGITPLSSQMAKETKAAYPRTNVQDMVVGVSAVPTGGIHTFIFGGLRWDFSLLLTRCAWLVIAMLLVIASTPLFDRFRRESRGVQGTPRFVFDVMRVVPNVPWMRVFRAELGLLINATGSWWLLGALGILAAGAILPPRNSIMYVVPIALIWPIERWSSLGSRESRWNTAELLAATPRYASRTLILQWLAGTTLGVVLVCGVLLHLAIAGQFLGLFACVATVAAIAALGLACGILAGTPRLFEGAYLLLWYLGPINHIGFLDFSAAIVNASAMLLIVSTCAAVLAIGMARIARSVAQHR